MAEPTPTLVHVRWPFITAELLTDAHHARIEARYRVPDREPLVDLTTDHARALLAEADVLLTGWGAPRLDAAALDAAPKLRMVAHAAGTVKDLIDDSFWTRNIALSSAAAANAVPVAEFTVAAILFSGKQVFRLQQHYRTNRSWELWTDVAPGLGNLRKRVGLVGASRIGRLVIEMLRPFQLDVVVADPYLDAAEAEALGVERVELDELLASCDIVSLHAPLLPSTRGMLDARRLALLPDGATLVNTARGALIDLDALTAELVSGRIDAVIDVTDPEVLPAESPLYDLPNVFLTPHIAGSQGAETQRMADLAIDELERFLDGEPLRHQVTQADLDRIA